jgi:protein-tyrosine sulfotransferase
VSEVVDDPIFIHGVLPRSGTNFLWDLLLLHPDCVRTREPIREALFLDHSDQLTAFVDRVRETWDPIWGTFTPDLEGRFCEGIGEGLLSFLRMDKGRLVIKAPSVQHLERFFTFFPRGRLLILMRDGRAVAQSAMATLGWDFERACRAWATAADTICHFQQTQSAHAERWRLVRYEDLVDDTETELRSLFRFLDLDPSKYDFDAARNLPVRGSSWYGRREAPVDWQTVPKDASFAPKERWRSWSSDRLDRFDWLAGSQLRRFGYARSSVNVRVGRSMSHTVRDWRWRIVTATRLTIFRTRVRLGLRRRLGLVRET